MTNEFDVKNDTLNKRDEKKSKLFKCKDCKEEFGDKINLYTHINKYHPHKIKCSICDFEGHILSDIDEHMVKSHSSERKFKCNKCESTFMSEIRMKKHEKIHEVNVSINF